MTSTIHCPGCNVALKVPQALLGRKAKCPHCNSTIQLANIPSVFHAPDAPVDIPFNLVDNSPLPAKRKPSKANALVIGISLGTTATLALLLGAFFLPDSKGRDQSSTPTVSDMMKVRGYFREEAENQDGRPMTFIGVVLSIPASRLMPTPDEYEKILLEQRQRETGAEESPRAQPPSATHIQLLDPALFTLEFDPGHELRADHFFLPDKGNTDRFVSRAVSITSYGEKEFDRSKIISFCIGIVDDQKQIGRPLRIRLRQESAVNVPDKTVTVGDLPAPKELDHLNISLPDFRIPYIPPITLPPIPIVVP